MTRPHRDSIPKASAIELAMHDTSPSVAFADLGLSPAVLGALTAVGYESPSPIQQATIPVLLQGRDLIGQAQTGTGKTAAFALPLLSRIDVARREPQALILVPTRELAIQVAEACQKYGSHMPGLHVLPIYGGQSYTPQLNALRRGVHVIVATPGRVMDHLERGTLSLDTIAHVVLDEADEMLQMGFVDAIDHILGLVPPERQVALFSATLPAPIRRIAQKHLRDPREITVKSKTATAANIRQRYWLVSGIHKLDALTRLLEVEPFDAMLVFARTKQSTVELVEKLEARGFAAAALNGDILQAQRERTIAALKTGKVDIASFTCADDFGHVMNPMIVQGQVHGGVGQGIGQALLENTSYDENGQLLTASFMDYAMPRADDVPFYTVDHSCNTPCTHNPLGVKGCGEAGAIGSPPAVVNAVIDALHRGGMTHVKHIDMPVSPARVWSAING